MRVLHSQEAGRWMWSKERCSWEEDVPTAITLPPRIDRVQVLVWLPQTQVGVTGQRAGSSFSLAVART